MKILSMTATFGKLSRSVLTLEPGLNVIDAPNEWGKSTWCAFIMAMLYGIDTGDRTKAGHLADKEHYAPWSGEPMSGSMQILWNGREITLQRQNKGRTPLGEVKAYETHTGIPVPELEIAAPGQVLLGVERNVFARAGFVRRAQMPVTEDDALRRRLNELVTTGDESGASDDLEQKLNKLKNKCKHNKTGLIPETEAELKAVEDKLQQMRSLQEQIDSITQQQIRLQQQLKLLENHRQALQYAQQQQYTQKLAAAQVRRDTQAQTLLQAQALCENLPSQEKLRQDMAYAQQLRETRDALHTKAQLLPPLPQEPIAPEVFRGKDPDTVAADAALDGKVFAQLHKDLKKPIPYIVGGVLLAAGIGLMLVSIVAGALALLAGAGAIFAGIGKQKKLKKQIAELSDRYRGIPADRWETAAGEYAAAQLAYRQALQTRQQELADIDRQMTENTGKINTLTANAGIAAFEEQCRQAMQAYTHLEEQRRLLHQAEDVLQALTGAGKEVQPAQFEDTLTYTMAETDRYLAENDVQRRLLHQRLGQCQGQMEALGQAEALRARQHQLQARIAMLETYDRAIARAQQTLQAAKQELQRRFAPQIAHRAQELFGALTRQRYQRLMMGQDFSLETVAGDEVNTHGTLWRSDGTVDQMYLALRMAVAEALTPEAPLVLDDALVCFDDDRLAAALEILQQASDRKQVIIFTCQSREREWKQEAAE